MTSRSLCFKLMKENLKRRMWTIALTILSLVFTLLVPAAIQSGTYLDRMAEGMRQYEIEQWTQRLVGLVGVNGLVVAVLVALAVVWGVSGFCYLHNSRQVDFYHSIPVKRGQLFVSSFINGILVPAAIYFVTQAVSAMLVKRTGIHAPELGSLWWKMYLLNMLYYTMLYTTAVIAVMMTGNLIVTLLGTVVFCAYGPGLVVLVRGYQQMWFHTIHDTEAGTMWWHRILDRSSPFASYMYSLVQFAEGDLEITRIAGAVVVMAALAALAYGLYRIRPSESAGKAMAFKVTQTPVKLLIALPVSVVFGMFFYTLRSTLPWGVFGALCGSLITCCLMEIIYHLDFRKLFANWIQLAACGAVSVLLILAGIYDWYGYDSWLPKATSVKSASVWLGYEDDWVTYGKPERDTDSLGQERFIWSYEGQQEYQYEHMELTDIYSVMELAAKGVRADQEIRAEGREMWEYWGDDRQWRTCVVCFRVKGGREVFRRYRIPVDDEVKTVMASIHDSQEYKRGTYPVLAQTAADTAAVYVQNYNQLEELTLDGEERAKLLAIYQKDLEELTMAVRERELPIGTIQFRTVEHEEAVEFYQDREDGDRRLADRCYYPVYPSFTRTLEAIRGAGGTVEEITGDMISEVRVRYYSVYEGDDMTQTQVALARAAREDQDVVYDEKADIDALSKALVFRDYYGMNEYYQADYAYNVDVTVVFDTPRISSGKVSYGSSCQIDMRCLTEEEIGRFGFLQVTEEK